jgi:hypothetical protein
MLKLIERNIDTVGHRLVLLAPPQAVISPAFTRVDIDPLRRRWLIREVQRLRGGIYLRDGAISHDQLSPEGLHQTPEDERSWHLLITDPVGRLTACVWYLEHENTTSLDRLRVRNCPLAQQAEWHDTLRRAVSLELLRARRDGLHYAEVGGWAVAEECRCKSEGLLLALAAYSLGRIGGGALGMTTATVRHSSSTILRRLGGSHLQVDGVAVPPYYDPRYRCEMELLRFDSRRPDTKYRGLVERLSARLTDVLVVAASAAALPEEPFGFLHGTVQLQPSSAAA